MPIRRELRKYYGAEHRAQREAMIALFGPICRKCGRECQEYLNLAHVTHDPRAGETTTLWCPSCHATHDAQHRYAMTRRSRAKKVGQRWLLPEIQWAPYPGWMVPRRVIDAAQGTLF